jgi:hypothetical protein
MSAVRSVLVGGACGLLLVTGCSAAAPKATMVSTSPPLVTASQSTSPSVSAEVGKSYLKALFSGDAGVMREGLKLTAPNSVAYHWLDHEANLAEGLPRVGDAVPKAVIAAASGDAFNECSGPAEDATCTTFGGFKVNGHGKLVDLTVNKQPIGPRLTVGRGQTVTAAATKFTLLTAYQSVVSGTWIITVRVQTGAEPIRINPKTWSYRGPDGKPGIWTGGPAATHVVSSASLIAVVMFESGNAGGKLTVQGCLARLSYAAPGEEDKLCPDASFSAVLKVG